jgi:bifunctional non-homologous end joining protein LigD
LKVVNQQDFVICGFTKGAREFGALVLGYYELGKLLWAGNVGTGFDQESLKDIHRTLQGLAVKRNPFAAAHAELKGATWVRPELVCTVKFAMWTPDLRLRAPVFLGLRPDADPHDCVREVAGEAAAPPPSAGKTRGARTHSAGQPDSSARKPLLEGKQEEVFVEVDGHRLRFTHLNKVFYPREGYKKRDVINYYDAIASLILPHLHDRPLSLKRYPDGIDGEYFFQKEAPKGTPSWLRTAPIKDANKTTNFVLADDRASLLHLANLGCIDQNPWMSRVGSLHNPDFILIDLDPFHCEYDRIVEAAQLVRRQLERIGLEGYAKTTGGDGMHIYIPVQPVYTYDQTRTFAEILSRLVTAERPDLFTLPRALAKREKGKVYFDFLQNGEGKTISAPYVLRAYPGAPVATPLAWREVAPGLSPKQFHLGNVVDRFARLGDLFEPVLTKPQRLEDALEQLGPLLREPQPPKRKGSRGAK